jgi:hypothetical protein
MLQLLWDHQFSWYGSANTPGKVKSITSQRESAKAKLVRDEWLGYLVFCGGQILLVLKEKREKDW